MEGRPCRGGLLAFRPSGFHGNASTSASAFHDIPRQAHDMTRVIEAGKFGIVENINCY